MGNASRYFRGGSWNVVCDTCGNQFKANELTPDGQTRGGLRVCHDCWDMLHPQELMRPVPDPKAIPWSRPGGDDIFVQVGTTNYSVDATLLDSTFMG